MSPAAAPRLRAAVLGRPVAHSLSPVLHRAACAVLGLDVASGGGIKPFSTFDADHQCSSAWGIVTF